MSDSWETEKIGNIAIVRGSNEELQSFKDILKSFIKTDITDSINIEFVVNETKQLVEKHRALSYLKNCLEIPPKKIEDPLLFPELHAELCDKQYETPSIDQFNKFELPISCLQACFLVEAFCPDQNSNEKHLYDKRFLKAKTIYNLLLFASFPVSLEPVIESNV